MPNAVSPNKGHSGWEMSKQPRARLFTNKSKPDTPERSPIAVSAQRQKTRSPLCHQGSCADGVPQRTREPRCSCCSIEPDRQRDSTPVFRHLKSLSAKFARVPGKALFTCPGRAGKAREGAQNQPPNVWDLGVHSILSWMAHGN